MANYTSNLNLEKPLQSEGYDVDVFNANADKIDNFAGQVPARALTADALTTARNINGVSFKGNADIVTGLGMYSETVNYSIDKIAYKIINGKAVVKKSIIDNNLGNDFNDNNYWIDAGLGSGQWGYILGNIQDQTDLINLLNNKSNTDLSNLTSIGNAKFQYAPFSINSGSVDASGNNNTLIAGGDAPQIITLEKYIVPPLSSNNSQYGVCNDYTLTQTKSYSFSNFTNPWTIELAADNYIPAGAKVTWTMSTYNAGQQIEVSGNFYYQVCGCSSGTITYTYTDDTQEVIYTHNGGTFTGTRNYNIELPIANKTVKAIKWTGGNPSTGYNPIYDAYYNAWGITFKAQWQETISSADTLICAPCTITTADGRTKTFENNSVLDCSDYANGSYKVFKSYTDGSLSACESSAFSISRTAPAAPSDNYLHLWLDTSQYPLTLKQYDSGSSQWVINNDLVYLGDVTISGGVITAVKNNYFNACPAFRYPVETYQNGASWYCVYSDGWCEQGGEITASQTVSYLKPFLDNNYTLVFGSGSPTNYSGTIPLTQFGWYGASGKTPNSFTATADVNHTKNWTACGYIK